MTNPNEMSAEQFDQLRDLAIARAMRILGDSLEWDDCPWDETEQTEEVRDLTWALQACLEPSQMTAEGKEGVARFLEREGEGILECEPNNFDRLGV